ncbi:hypothetical protein RHGRI_008609 [Rhododendron griersonianum]|uniref:Reticulon-like protein n=1 Tax=Rhododendron griersonianum TaxID=479676 RepID=A0AAV6L2K9_9ERIC|nr:hypothetical protein RHGRI_008609 [Rhododendron griersonianum]
MADNPGENESVTEKITEKFHDHDSSSSSSSDSENEKSSPSPSAVKPKIYRILGRERPLHKVLGGGKHPVSYNVLIGSGLSSPPQIPEVSIPDEIILGVASALRVEINGALAILRDIASGKDLKKFLAVIAGLWLVSILGGCCNFLTLFYICFVLLHTVPVLYEKYEDHVDPFAEKAHGEIKKQYAVFDAKVLSKIPRGPLKDKKFA